MERRQYVFGDAHVGTLASKRERLIRVIRHSLSLV
jgi:hypothetical protein